MHSGTFPTVIEMPVNPKLIQRLDSFADLSENWDGYGGLPSSDQTRAHTAELLLEIDELAEGRLEDPFIAPMPDGGIELEWNLRSGAELMLDVSPSSMDIAYLLDELAPSGEIVESEGAIPKDAMLSELINRLLAPSAKLRSR